MKEALYNLISRTGVRALSKVFPEYFAREPLKPTDRYIEYPFLIRNLPKPPARVLDVGCAGSFFPLLLASFGYEAYGIDIREYAIINKIKFDNFQFDKNDIRKSSFPDDFFNVITAVSTVEHIGISGRHGESEDLSGDKKAIDEMKRILRLDGAILLTVPFGKAKIIKPYCRIYDPDAIRRLIKGLEIEKEEYYMQDPKDNWVTCSKARASDVTCSPSHYALCLLKLKKI